jgi:psiF repeat-containing protein
MALGKGDRMRRSTWLVGIGAMLAMLAGQATLAQSTSSTSAHPNSQQEKMKTCNAAADTKSLKGDDRKTFMQTCLSKGGSASAKTGNSQQEKMKTCNADASSKGLKGDDRQAFMKTCLSGP